MKDEDKSKEQLIIELHELCEQIAELRKNRAEEALRASEQRMADIIDFLPDATFAIDSEGIVIAWNRAMEEMTRVLKESMIGKGNLEYSLPFYGKRRPLLIDLIFASEEEIQKDYRSVSKIGETIVVEAFVPGTYGGKGAYLWGISTPLYDKSGKVIGAIESIRDITERTKQTGEIEHLNRLYSVLSRVSQAVVRATSPEKFLEEACREVVEGGGFLLAWIGQVELTTNAIVPIAVWGRIGEYVQVITVYADTRPEGFGPTGTCVREHHSVVHNDFLHDPQTLPWRDQAAPFGITSAAAFPIERGGRAWGALTIYSDEVDRFGGEDVKLLEKVAGDIEFALDNLDREFRRKQVEEALRENQSRLELALESAQMGVWHWDLIKDKRFFDDQVCHLLGIDAAKFTGTADEFYNTVHPNDRKVLKAALAQTVGQAVPYETEYRAVWSDGSVHYITSRAKLFCNEIGQPVRINGLIWDTTERKRTEEERERLKAQLRQAQKMEALGTLAGGIAHDFNNMLAIIMGYTQLLLLEKDAGSDEHGQLNEVLKACRRAKNLVQQILAFSRQSDEKKQPLQVGLIVKEALKMLRATLPSTINVITKVTSEDVVLADPTQIHQVLMNLCTNAAHAMQEDGGTLEVSLTSAMLTLEDITSLPDLKPGPHVKLTVKDSGCGISPAILDRIFDPFFTTKEKGVGTGLGLAVVYGILKSHGGTIEVSSIPGEGTTFHVFLPSIEKAPVKEEADSALLPRGWERVLVVDDEPVLAEATSQMLERLGYQVDIRINGIEALEAFRNQSEEKRFDLVITDMTMPHLTGIELAKELLKLDRNLPILLCTGFSRKVDAEKAARIGIKGFLMKPVVFGELAGMVRKALDEKVR